MGEEWRPIPGTEGRYSVSNRGVVRGENVNQPRRGRRRTLGPLKPSLNRYGYERVTLGLGGTRWHATIHRLVCGAFHGPPPNDKPLACHRDGNTLNNRADNLYWGSASDNMQDVLRHGNNRNANKTHCPKGHEYSERNTYRDSKNIRHCRECAKMYQRGRRARQRREEQL